MKRSSYIILVGVVALAALVPAALSAAEPQPLPVARPVAATSAPPPAPTIEKSPPKPDHVRQVMGEMEDDVVFESPTTAARRAAPLQIEPPDLPRAEQQ